LDLPFFSLEANRDLFVPGVGGERLLVLCARLFNLTDTLLHFRDCA
jgi:hypothetical protein